MPYAPLKGWIVQQYPHPPAVRLQRSSQEFGASPYKSLPYRHPAGRVQRPLRRDRARPGRVLQQVHGFFSPSWFLREKILASLYYDGDGAKNSLYFAMRLKLTG